MFTKRQQELIAIWNDVTKYPTIADVSKAFRAAKRGVYRMASTIRGLSPTALVDRDKIYHDENKKIAAEIPSLPDGERPIEEVIKQALQENQRQQQFHAARNIIDVRINHDGPIAVALLPDPHLDDSGTDLASAIKHAEIIRDTPGMYAVCVGDFLNNFHALRSMHYLNDESVLKVSETFRLQEWWLEQMAAKFVGIASGNHDAWPSRCLDPLGMALNKLQISGIYGTDQVRVRLNLPSGSSFIYLIRHIFPGHSKYNAAHGVLAWLLEQWQGETAVIGGHKHVASHVSISRDWEGESRVVHGVQLSSYKKIDQYAVTRGFRKCDPFTTPALVHTPDGKTRFVPTIEEAQDWLKFLS